MAERRLAPVLCACGCGEVTNAVIIEAQRLRDENGETWSRAAAKLGVSYAYIKELRRSPPKRKRGHNRGPNATRRVCPICDRGFFTSHPTESICTSGFCRIEGWRRRSVERAEQQAETFERWREKRRLRAAARAAECERLQAWRLAEWERRSRERARLNRDRTYRREMRWAEEAIRRAARQDRQVERRVKRAFAQPTGVRLNSVRHVDDGAFWGHGHDFVGDPWNDSTFDEVAQRVGVDVPEFFALARRATFVPEDFYRRCRDGDLLLVVDDEGVRFVIRRAQTWDAVPWHGNPNVKGFGGSMGKKSSRHRGRLARSASARGKRSSRSQPKVSR